MWGAKKKREKEKQATVKMWVSLQIILSTKDAYPEELTGLVIVIFDSLFNFHFSRWLRPHST